MTRLFALVAILSFGATAYAEPRVRIGKIEGSLKASVKSAIVRGLADKALISDDAPLTVRAKSERLGAKWQVTLELVDARGVVQKRWKVRSKKITRVSYLVRKLFWKKLGGTITRLDPSGGKDTRPGKVAPPPPPPRVVPPPTETESEVEPELEAETEPEPEPEAEPSNVVILSAEGGSARRVISAIETALAKDARYDLLSTEDAEVTADRLEISLDTPNDRVEVAREEKITAWLQIVARYKRKRYRVSLTVLNGVDGEVLDTADIVARSKRTLQRAVTAEFVRLVVKTNTPKPLPPPPPPPAPVAIEPVTTVVAEPEPEPTDIPAWTRSRLRLKVEVGLFSRALSYNDDLFGELMPYDIVGAPAIGLDATWFFPAHLTEEWYRHIGLDLSVSYGVGLASKNNSGDEFPTSALVWNVGAYGRLPIGEHEIGLLLGVGGERFAIDASNDQSPGVPGVNYVNLRVGGRVRVQITNEVSLRGEGGYRLVLGAGEIRDDTWFPRASVGAADAEIGGSYALGHGLFADAGFAMRRYFYAFSPEPGDPWIAGGAADQFFVLNVGFGWYW